MTQPKQPDPLAIYIYVKVDWDGAPSGWEIALMRSSRKNLDKSVSKHHSRKTEYNTVHTKDKETLFNEEGELIQTAGKATYRTILQEAQAVDIFYKELSEDTGTPEQVLRIKVLITLVGNHQAALAQ